MPFVVNIQQNKLCMIFECSLIDLVRTLLAQTMACQTNLQWPSMAYYPPVMTSQGIPFPWDHNDLLTMQPLTSCSCGKISGCTAAPQWRCPSRLSPNLLQCPVLPWPRISALCPHGSAWFKHIQAHVEVMHKAQKGCWWLFFAQSLSWIFSDWHSRCLNCWLFADFISKFETVACVDHQPMTG